MAKKGVKKVVKKYGRGKHPNSNRMKENAGYSAIHLWIKSHKPKPQFCECCKMVSPYDLANISGKYKRDINDFEWLCRKCHMHKDGRAEQVKNNLVQFQRECDYCKNKIKYGEKHVSLQTFKDAKIIQNGNWHFDCWKEYFNKAVLKKAQGNLKTIQEKAVGVFNNPMLAGLLSKIGGSDKLMEMVSKPIGENSDFENLKEMFSPHVDDQEVKKNGKRKQKRKTKVSKV